MKVLWFANTPCNADEYFNKELMGTGGWLKMLNKHLQNKVELHIAFYHKEELKPFKYEKTHYYPIKKNSKPVIIFKKIINIPIYDEDIDLYNEIINVVEPDLIHIHGTEGSYGCLLGKFKTPVVISLQGILKVIAHKYFNGIEYKYCGLSLFKYIPFLGKSIFYKDYVKILRKSEIETLVLRNTKFLIGRTDWDRRVSYLLAPNSKYFHNDEMLRNGFYENEWKPLLRDKMVIYTTSGNNYYKGLETIYLATIELNRTGVIFEWNIAGISGNDPIVAVIKRKFNIKDFPNNIVFLGKLNEGQIIRNLLEADMFVMTSHIENSPNSLCEAMILGVPCISTLAGGSGSLLRDRIDGILIQSGDPWAMAGAILELNNNPSLGIKLGQNARKIAMQRHNKEKITNDLVAIYKSILEVN